MNERFINVHLFIQVKELPVEFEYEVDKITPEDDTENYLPMIICDTTNYIQGCLDSYIMGCLDSIASEN